KGTVQAQSARGPAASRQTRAALATSGTLETLISQKTGMSEDTIGKFEVAMLSALADKGAGLGLSSAQMGNLQPATVSPVLNSVFDAMAKSAGTSDTDLFNGISSGQSLAQVAAAHGIDAATLKANLTK